jgi:hypothetical protein
MITAMPNDHHYEIVSTSTTLSRRAKHQRNILRKFINQWRRDYLLNLRENSAVNSRNFSNSTEISEGDIVLLRSDSTARNFWQLAVIEEFISSRDGKIRAAIVRTSNGQGKPSRLRRVIQHLIYIINPFGNTIKHTRISKGFACWTKTTETCSETNS